MKLLIILSSEQLSSIYLLENLSKDEFNHYLTANNKTIGIDGGVTEDLNIKLQEAAVITNPTDERVKNIDGVIALQLSI